MAPFVTASMLAEASRSLTHFTREFSVTATPGQTSLIDQQTGQFQFLGCEPAMVDAAVGLANCGKVPIANTFAFLFATRALEMVRTHLCYGDANVKLAGAYAGLSDSFDGPTHHAITDVAILRSLPRMTVVIPADPWAVAKLLPQVAAWKGPVYFRLCRNDVPEIYTAEYQPDIGKGVVLVDGGDVTILACGVLVARAVEATRLLASEGVAARLVEIH